MVRITTLKQHNFLSPIQSCAPIFKKIAVRSSPDPNKIGFSPERVLIRAQLCCASGRRLGSQHRCLRWADRADSFYVKILNVSYSTFLSFENQTQVYSLS